jgi:Flp pilus assembly protein TadB
MSRWILTALPVVLALFLWVSNPDSMNSFVSSNVGQIALVAATLMVVAGSLVIQRIVDIDV